MNIDSVSKIICVAKNYSDVSTERAIPLTARMSSAAIFLKPPSSITSIEPTINLFGYTDVICETELAVQIQNPIPRNMVEVTDEQLLSSIGGFGIAFDLTRKDLQNKLKAEGKPWELSKAFDNACPLSELCKADGSDWLSEPMDISLTVNDQLILRQPTTHMILSIADLLRTITRDFSLWPGDIILTGTPTKPHQPPRIKPGDKLRASLGKYMTIETHVV